MNVINRFKKLLPAVAAVACVMAFSAAQAQVHTDKETKEDIQRHRAMSAAHESAAKCLEAGKTEDACMLELQSSCKGLAIGKYCGMKHVH